MNSTEDECPVCYKTYGEQPGGWTLLKDGPQSAQCKHSLCVDCCIQLSLQPTASCPMCREDWTEYLSGYAEANGYDEEEDEESDDEDDEDDEEDEEDEGTFMFDNNRIVRILIKATKDQLIEETDYTENDVDWKSVVNENVIDNISSYCDRYPLEQEEIVNQYGIHNARRLLIDHGYGNYSNTRVMAYEILRKVYEDIRDGNQSVNNL